MRRILPYCAFLAAILTTFPALAQPLPSWQEHSGVRHDYNLSGVRILVIAADQFNDEEATQMARCWRGWGAKVEFAGPSQLLTGEIEAPPGAATRGPAPTLRVDYLLQDVDPSPYDLVYIAGGEGIPQLLDKHRPQLARIIDAAARAGRLIAAICHGPLALTASPFVKGRRVTANGGAQMRALRQAGANYVDEIVVTDGRLLTGQWPHLETFAVTVAEKLQYPSGGGPFEKALAARPAGVRLVRDLRRTAQFKPDPVDVRIVEQAIQSSMATIARSSRGTATVKYVLVSNAATRAQLWQCMVEAGKGEFTAMGLNEANLQRAFGPLVESAPVMLVAFVVPAAIDDQDLRDRTLRIDIGYAGAAVANFVTAARSLGLGVAMFDYVPFMKAADGIKRVLQVPDAAVLANIMFLGRAAAEAPPIPVRPASEVLSFERWNGSAAIR